VTQRKREDTKLDCSIGSTSALPSQLGVLLKIFSRSITPCIPLVSGLSVLISYKTLNTDLNRKFFCPEYVGSSGRGTCQCSKCNQWLHPKCAEIKLQQWLENATWCCLNCCIYYPSSSEVIEPVIPVQTNPCEGLAPDFA